METNCYLVIFDSTHQALRGEEVLKKTHLPHEVISTPPQFKSGCGISLRIPLGTIKETTRALDEASIIYSRIEPFYCRWLG